MLWGRMKRKKEGESEREGGRGKEVVKGGADKSFFDTNPLLCDIALVLVLFFCERTSI